MSDEWDYEISEDSEVVTVTCPDCGKDSGHLSMLAVAGEKVSCRHCGNEKDIDAPSPWLFLLIVLAAVVATWLLDWGRAFKQVVWR